MLRMFRAASAVACATLAMSQDAKTETTTTTSTDDAGRMFIAAYGMLGLKIVYSFNRLSRVAPTATESPTASLQSGAVPSCDAQPNCAAVYNNVRASEQDPTSTTCLTTSRFIMELFMLVG